MSLRFLCTTGFEKLPETGPALGGRTGRVGLWGGLAFLARVCPWRICWCPCRGRSERPDGPAAPGTSGSRSPPPRRAVSCNVAAFPFSQGLKGALGTSSYKGGCSQSPQEAGTFVVSVLWMGKLRHRESIHLPTVSWARTWQSNSRSCSPKSKTEPASPECGW